MKLPVPSVVVFDATIVGQLSHPNRPANRPVDTWFQLLLGLPPEHVRVCLPQIIDYEVRRKLRHLERAAGADGRAATRLDRLGEVLDFLPLTRVDFAKGAELWATARASGVPTAPPDALDGDVLLAAQTLAVGGIAVTANRRHLVRYGVTAVTWQEVEMP